ncbi:MAG TPA: xanthine dehydrogenase family protein subunit M [Burkholderiales bacterium]|nr:xanthine dehydrogenase family protein subunit M [Burkholderiales bacterium]
MTPFELTEPRSLAEAVELLQAREGTVRPLAGGTALMLMMKAGVLRPTRLVNLRRLGFDHLEVDARGSLQIGAMVTLRALELSPAVRKGWPVIARALRTLSNVRVRNVARVGGHLAHGDPHMDLPPLLCALGANVTIAGPRGERDCPVEELYAGYLETTLAPGELITRVSVPPMDGRRAAYLKCTTRSADDWPALGMAVVLDGNAPRIFVSAATDRPTRLTAAEQILAGKALDERLLGEAAAAAQTLAIDGDLHGSAAYKKHLVGVYLRRAIHEARQPGH